MTLYPELRNYLQSKVSTMVTELKVVPIKEWIDYKFGAFLDLQNFQKDNLISTGIFNGAGELKFIYTERTAKLNNELMALMKEPFESPCSYGDNKDAEIIDACYNAMIEHAKITVADAFSICREEKKLDELTKDERMFINCLNANKEIDLRVPDELNYSLGKIWNLVVENVCENSSIRGYDANCYRIGDVRVGRYIPPTASEVCSLMQSLIEFICSDYLDEYPFVKACLIHYGFELIHPYCDGNGRLGRIIMNYYLRNRGINSVRDISVCKCIYDYRPLYYINLEEAENEYNDCTPFVEFLLQCFVQAYNHK